MYSMQTFSDLANRTGVPVLVQTTVLETLANGSHVTYKGGVGLRPEDATGSLPVFPNLKAVEV